MSSIKEHEDLSTMMREFCVRTCKTKQNIWVSCVSCHDSEDIKMKWTFTDAND